VAGRAVYQRRLDLLRGRNTQEMVNAMSNRIITEIPISMITGYKPVLNEKTLELVDYLRVMFSSLIIELIPPIKVQKYANGQYVLKDGRHRVTAFRLLGEKKIRAKFSMIPAKKICEICGELFTPLRPWEWNCGRCDPF
jgi:hypothetical protein